MYKTETENVEIYFICDKRGDMELVETYYDEILDVHCWYFNAYLAYIRWQQNFKGLKMGEIAKKLLTVAASKYILYKLENSEYKSVSEQRHLKKDLRKIEQSLETIAKELDFI